MQTNERKQKKWKKFTDKKKKCHLLFDDSEEDWVKNYYYYTIVQRCISTNAKFKQNQSPLKEKVNLRKHDFTECLKKKRKNTFFL